MIFPTIFPPSISAGFSTRQGGVSQPPFDSLNLGLSTADSKESVRKNRAIAAASLGLTEADMAIAGQVHGADVLTVTEPGLFPGFDGLVTRTPGLLLSISAADCAAVLLADPVAGVIGACHAGWRGHVAGIERNTLQAMVALGASPTHIRAFIGPCISQKNFEVGDEVAVQFDDGFVERNVSTGKAHVDLSGSIMASLMKGGVLHPNLEQSPLCTFQETDQLFSYRAQKGKTGRMMGMICIRPALSASKER